MTAQVETAAAALMKWWATKRQGGGETLLGTKVQEGVSLVFGLKRVPGKPSNKPRAM